MRRVICTLPEGGDITLHVGELTRSYRRGDVEDLDRVLVPSRPASSGHEARQAVTVADALGEHIEHFEPVGEDAHAAAPSAVDASAEHEESR